MIHFQLIIFHTFTLYPIYQLRFYLYLLTQQNLSMTTSFIPDAKHQQLNMSFTFDQQQESKVIINAMVDHTPYQLEFAINQDSQFQDIKTALISKQFKIVSKSPQILKLKIFFAYFQFTNVEKITLNTLKQTITDLNNKLKEQTQNNALLDSQIKQLRKQFDLTTTKLADYSRQNYESKIERQKLEKINQKERMEFEARIFKLEQQIFELNEEDLLRKVEEKFNKADEKRQEQHEKSTKDLQEKLTRISIEKISELENKLQQEQQKINKMQQDSKKSEEQKHLLQERLQEKNRRLNKLNQKFQQLQKKMLENFRLEREKWQLERRDLKKELIVKLQEQQLKTRNQMQQIKVVSEKFKNVQGKVNKFEEERLRKLQEKQKIKRKQEEERRRQLKQEEKILKIQQEKKLKLEKQRGKEQQPIQKTQIQNIQYRFSQTHKHSGIVLENNNTKASGQKLALVDGVVQEKGSSIRFRMESIAWDRSVSVGLGIRNVIAQDAYEFSKWNEVGHGCFFLSSNGTSYSHSNKDHNYVPTDFKYGVGDVILVQRNGDELLWRNEKTKYEMKRKVKLTADQWSQAYFCAYFNIYSWFGSSISICK